MAGLLTQPPSRLVSARRKTLARPTHMPLRCVDTQRLGGRVKPCHDDVGAVESKVLSLDLTIPIE